MKIDTPECDEAVYRARRRDLERLLGQPSVAHLRPCPECDIRCPCRGSRTCPCGCSPRCADAPAQMSSEPEAHPIEPGIAPLVYSLYALRVCHPCWSCEGHYDAGGRLSRLPSVWFHSSSATYPAVIAECLWELEFANKLASPWRVAAVAWGNRLDSTFSIEPDLRRSEPPPLSALHRDVEAIAAALVDEARRISALALGEVEGALAVAEVEGGRSGAGAAPPPPS
jgi:hypothetical protein